MLNDHAKNLPIFWGHGRQDPLVRYIWAEQSVNYLKNVLGLSEATGDDPTGIEFHGYHGLVHSASDKEIDDLQTWLCKVVPEQ